MTGRCPTCRLSFEDCTCTNEGRCRIMETRACPIAGCHGKPCARFESDDPTPWEDTSISERWEKIVRHLGMIAVVAEIVTNPNTARIVQTYRETVGKLIRETREHRRQTQQWEDDGGAILMRGDQS